jgi:hypothetical protein
MTRSRELLEAERRIVVGSSTITGLRNQSLGVNASP